MKMKQRQYPFLFVAKRKNIKKSIFAIFVQIITETKRKIIFKSVKQQKGKGYNFN